MGPFICIHLTFIVLKALLSFSQLYESIGCHCVCSLLKAVYTLLQLRKHVQSLKLYNLLQIIENETVEWLFITGITDYYYLVVVIIIM